MPFKEDSYKKRVQKCAEKRKVTQSDIEELAKYIYHYRKQNEFITSYWVDFFAKTEEPYRKMNMIWMINHLLQLVKYDYRRNKKISQKQCDSLVKKFSVTLPHLLQMFGEQKLDDKTVTRVERCFDIWRDRKILSSKLIQECEGKFRNQRKAPRKRNTSENISKQNSGTPEPIFPESDDDIDPLQRVREPEEVFKVPKQVFKSRPIKKVPKKSSKKKDKEIPKYHDDDENIFLDEEWLDNVIQEIVGISEGNYITDINGYNAMDPTLISPKLFADKMTSILQAPASLDAKARTNLTHLPPELSDPNKIVELVVEAQGEADAKNLDQIERREHVNKKLQEVKDRVTDFKSILELYNTRLGKELTERQEAGMISMLSARERKISHKHYIMKQRDFAARKEQIELNRKKLEEMMLTSGDNIKLPDNDIDFQPPDADLLAAEISNTLLDEDNTFDNGDSDNDE